MPHNLTTIQQEEWKNEHATLFNKSFVGQKVSKCPAEIRDIGHDKITAYANYHLDYLVFYRDGSHYHYEKNKSRRIYTQISYEILYEKSNFYNQIKSIYAQEMVEIEGIIQKVNWGGRNASECFEYYLSIQLSLTSINKTENRFLHAELLDENLKYQSSFKNTMGCFIATVCYGNYDAPEVLVLRQFRDDKLLKTSFGKAFVKFYYSVSPFLATLISKSDLLKKSVQRYFLEPIVTKLQRQKTK